MSNVVIHERLRQARLSFNLALMLTAATSITSIAGIALLLSGQAPEGTVTTVAGLASNIVSVGYLKFTNKANDRLDKMARLLKEEAQEES